MWQKSLIQRVASSSSSSSGHQQQHHHQTVAAAYATVAAGFLAACAETTDYSKTFTESVEMVPSSRLTSSSSHQLSSASSSSPMMDLSRQRLTSYNSNNTYISSYPNGASKQSGFSFFRNPTKKYNEQDQKTKIEVRIKRRPNCFVSAPTTATPAAATAVNAITTSTSTSTALVTTNDAMNKKKEEYNDKANHGLKRQNMFYGQCLERQIYKPKVPYPAWDYNWDGRMTDDTSMEGHFAGRDKVINATKKTRHIILVRHGQYHEDADNDNQQTLTPLGRIQAIKTGQRLAAMAKGFGGCTSSLSEETPFASGSTTSKSHSGAALPISKIRVSNMTRAKETAALIAQEMLKHNISVKVEKPDPTLNEAIPAPTIPFNEFSHQQEERDMINDEIDQDRERVELAFQKYFYRHNDEDDENDNNNDNQNHHENSNSNSDIIINSKEEEEEEELDDFEIVVCHGNLIRYFFCRALQIPPEAWLRMSIYNCSMTYLTIRPNGHVTARMLGDIGHLDYKEYSYSSLLGFKW